MIITHLKGPAMHLACLIRLDKIRATAVARRQAKTLMLALAYGVEAPDLEEMGPVYRQQLLQLVDDLEQLRAAGEDGR